MLKTMWVGVLSVVLWPGGIALLAGQKSASKAPADPIEKALASGVDKIPGGNGTQSPPALQRRNPRYQVETGDVISLDFPFTPKFNQTVTVNPDGYVTLQGVGDIHIEEETVPQIQSDVEKAYGKILRNPEVSVTLKQFENPYFLALGQVAKPGKYNLEGDTTVAEAIAMAGGFTPKAKHSDVLLFRRVSDNWVSAEKLNVKHMLGSGNLSAIPPLACTVLLHPLRRNETHDGTTEHNSIYRRRRPARSQYAPGSGGHRLPASAAGRGLFPGDPGGSRHRRIPFRDQVRSAHGNSGEAPAR
jgi:Polysaccharide biosynthesis/export protein/SLBB domain